MCRVLTNHNPGFDSTVDELLNKSGGVLLKMSTIETVYRENLSELWKMGGNPLEEIFKVKCGRFRGI